MNTDSQLPRLLCHAALSAAMLLMAAPVALADTPDSSLRTAQEHHACAVTMRLDPSEQPYQTCIKSLDRSLSESDQERLVESNRQACIREYLDPGTSAFAICMVKAEQSVR